MLTIFAILAINRYLAANESSQFDFITAKKTVGGSILAQDMVRMSEYYPLMAIKGVFATICFFGLTNLL